MKNFSRDFKPALKDYLYLLENNYPQKVILKLVGDRYKLSGIERSVLYRGVTTKKDAEKRKSKLTDSINEIPELHIDTFNQILTIGSYLNGNVVFISRDGFLRDASEIHGKAFGDKLLNRSIELIFSFLSEKQLKNILFYIDRQVGAHQKVGELITNYSNKYKAGSEVFISETVDKDIGKINNGVIATSDSEIIDRSTVSVFDLARNVLSYHFNPEFVRLSEAVFVRLSEVET